MREGSVEQWVEFTPVSTCCVRTLCNLACSACTDRLRQPCRQRLHPRHHAGPGTVGAIPSCSVMHPSCMHPSQAQSRLVVCIVSCRQLLSLLVCTRVSVRVRVCVCVRVCFFGAACYRVCGWIVHAMDGILRPCLNDGYLKFELCWFENMDRHLFFQHILET
jgi:hypothetical protein